MESENNSTRRSVLKATGVAFGASMTALATTSNVSATHNEWNEGDIVSTDGSGVPGWYTCDFNNYDKYIDGQPGTIVGGPCYSGSTKYWEVDLSNFDQIRWFNQDLLTNERDG